MKKIFALMVVCALGCVSIAHAQNNDEPLPLPLGAQFTGKKLDVEKLKQSILNNKNFGSFNKTKKTHHPYASNFGALSTGTTPKNAAHIKTDFGLRTRKNKYSDVKIMPQPKGLRNIGCFGTPNAGKCE